MSNNQILPCGNHLCNLKFKCHRYWMFNHCSVIDAVDGNPAGRDCPYFLNTDNFKR